MQPMGEIKLDGHPLPEVEGDGNCQECTFSGLALALDIAPRDRVSVEWSEDSGATWRRRYTGIAVKSGSPQNPGTSGYKLVGLMKKMEEAEARTTLAKGDLGDQVQQLVTDTFASGQWANLINPTIVRQGVPAVTSGAIIPNFQPVSVVLKEKLCPRLLKSRVAVNADCQVLFGIPTGTLLIDEATPGVQVEWQEIGSEELLTDVRFQWSTGLDGSYYLGGAPLQVASPPLFTRLVHTTAGTPAWPYGHGVRSEGVTLDRADFAPVASVGYAFTADGNSDNVTVAGDPAALSDGDIGTSMTLTSSVVASGSHPFGVIMTYPGTTLPEAVLLQSNAVQLQNMTVLVMSGGQPVKILNRYAPNMHSSGVLLFPDDVRAAVAGFAGDTLRIVLNLMATDNDLALFTCCPATVGSRVAAVAQAMAKVPTLAAATATVPGWVDPQPTVQIQRRGPNHEDLGIVTLPGALFRYQPAGVTPPGSLIGLQTVIQLGQPDTAEALGEAALIKGRDRTATLKAISVAS
ncbi:hypothetical protein [Deinococcus altitudinis]|uniref:hypothetical protein n=1 Tax=Deinococcus altitudinis TaxID=468914 RepID=UPI003892B024